MDRKRGKAERSAESKALDVRYDNQKHFETWLLEHPIEIPQEIAAKIHARNAELASPTLTYERWSALIEEGKQRSDRFTAGEETLEDKYFRLSQLLTTVGQGPGTGRSELARLQEELGNCYCGSGKRFKECHGA